MRARALFVDADNEEQAERCVETFTACGAIQAWLLKAAGAGIFIFLLMIPRDQFSALQKSLIDKLGTDAAVHDLPRVMRLPGTLHLKDPAKPRLVKLSSDEPPRPALEAIRIGREIRIVACERGFKSGPA